MTLGVKKRFVECGLAAALAAAAAGVVGHIRLERAIAKAVSEGRLLAVLAGAGLGSYELVVWAGLSAAAILALLRWRLSRSREE